MSDHLEFTGERFTPECTREIWYEHYHRYVFAAGLVRGRRVLDAACGEGYGTSLLSRLAGSATGLDISAESVNHARSRYADSRARFVEGDCRNLPFEDDSFDCVVSFETLEHLAEQELLLSEFRRVLSPEGFILISTPDKVEYNRLGETANEHHVRELTAEQFFELLADRFPAVRMLGQKLMFQSVIWDLTTDEDQVARAEFLQLDSDTAQAHSRPLQTPVYRIALAAAEPRFLPSLDAAVSLFDDADESVYRHYHHEIRKNMAAGAILAQRDAELAALREQQEQAERTQPRPLWRRWLGR